MMLGNIVFGFLIRITLARRFPLEYFGLYYAVFAFLGLMGLLKNLGLNNAVIKYIPEFLINNEKDKVKTSILFLLFFSFTSSIIVAVFIYLFSPEISTHYFHDPAACKVLRIFLIFFIVSSLSSCLSSVFNAFQRPLLLSYHGLFINLILFVLIFLNDKLNIIYVSWYNNIVYIAVLIINTFFLFQIFNLFKHHAAPVWPVGKKLFKFGLASTASSVVSHTTGRLDTILLTFFQSLATVGVYSALTPFTKLFKIVGSSISRIFFPITSELYGAGKTEELKIALGRIHRYILIILTPLAIILFTYSDFILEVIFGREFIPGANAARIIVISALINPISIVNVGTINGLGFPLKNTVIVTISSITNIIFNIVLIPLWGFNGAAVAYFLQKIITFSATLFYLKKIINYRPEIFSMLKIVFIGLLVCGMMGVSNVFFNEPPLWRLLVQYSLVSLFGIFTYSIICMVFNIIRLDEIKLIAKILLSR
jgi:O-antigen/teichoic acid export membrane protein